jgi:hypothetical protein
VSFEKILVTYVAEVVGLSLLVGLAQREVDHFQVGVGDRKDFQLGVTSEESVFVDDQFSRDHRLYRTYKAGAINVNQNFLKDRKGFSLNFRDKPG